MAYAIEKQRKNIDLPKDSIRKLSLLAAQAGTSLKAYIENLLIQQADSVEISITQNPSPSGDKWFEQPENIEIIGKGIKSVKAGKVTPVSSEELKKRFNI